MILFYIVFCHFKAIVVVFIIFITVFCCIQRWWWWWCDAAGSKHLVHASRTNIADESRLPYARHISLAKLFVMRPQGILYSKSVDDLWWNEILYHVFWAPSWNFYKSVNGPRVESNICLPVGFKSETRVLWSPLYINRHRHTSSFSLEFKKRRHLEIFEIKFQYKPVVKSLLDPLSFIATVIQSNKTHSWSSCQFYQRLTW